MMRKIAALLCALTLISFSALAETHYCVAMHKMCCSFSKAGKRSTFLPHGATYTAFVRTHCMRSGLRATAGTRAMRFAT